MNVLVIGKAKTGTTVISKSIEASLSGPVQYHLEPNSPDFFETPRPLGTPLSHVVKIIFENWSAHPESRHAMVTNGFPTKFDRVVVIVRDPRDELISRLLYLAYPLAATTDATPAALESWARKLEEKEASPEAVSVQELFDELARMCDIRTENQIQLVLDQGDQLRRFIDDLNQSICVVRYEDFLQDKFQHLSNYLGIDVTRITHVGDDLQRTYRSAGYDNWKRVFTARDVAWLRSRFDDLLSRFGYQDWTLDPVPHLEAAQWSSYVRRITHEGFQQRKQAGPENR